MQINKLYFVVIFSASLMLSACSDSSKKESKFPSFSVTQIIDMSKNEREELERRCLGVSNSSCSNLSDAKSKMRARVDSCKQTKTGYFDPIKFDGGSQYQKEVLECEKYAP